MTDQVKSKTLFDKIWERHVVEELAGGWVLLHIDRRLLHDLSGTASLLDLEQRGLPVLNPNLVYATPDHAVSTAPGRTGDTSEIGAARWHSLKRTTSQQGIRLFDVNEPGHGIVHVMGPELGLVLPGLTVVCGDSHTCTNGALGAIAFGIGTSELTHALATQVLRQRKPKNMRINVDGALREGVSAKDLALYILGKIGTSAGTGFAIEYCGEAVRTLSIEQRMTLCNMSIEMGARVGLIAPDEKTISYVEGRPFAPKGMEFENAANEWRKLYTDDGAVFESQVSIKASEVTPMITWGTSPDQVMSVSGKIPDIETALNDTQRQSWKAALCYMGLEAGQKLEGVAIDRVFIGSCANSRMSDLREAAAIVRGRTVAKGVTAWVVPGSEAVKKSAEAEGLDLVFTDAGFEWREPGCGMCVAANGERAAPGERVISTSNRNFVGRQGPGARTHLAGPAVAAAAALSGVISNVRGF